MRAVTGEVQIRSLVATAAIKDVWILRIATHTEHNS
jgi:hypothetical protein